MLDILGSVLSAPLRIADATLRTAGVAVEELVGERGAIIDGKTFIGKAADELEDAITGID